MVPKITHLIAPEAVGKVNWCACTTGQEPFCAIRPPWRRCRGCFPPCVKKAPSRAGATGRGFEGPRPWLSGAPKA